MVAVPAAEPVPDHGGRVLQGPSVRLRRRLARHQQPPLLGRGYQSYEGYKYRILDNEYLALVIGVGVLGLLLYISILVATMTSAHATIRGPDPRKARYALAASATVAVLATATMLFNVLAFPHVPYLFFFIAGLIVALRRSRRNAPVPAMPRCSLRRGRRRSAPATGRRTGGLATTRLSQSAGAAT